MATEGPVQRGFQGPTLFDQTSRKATGRQRPEQRAYQQMVERFGGVYILARSVDDVWAALEHRGIRRTA